MPLRVRSLCILQTKSAFVCEISSVVWWKKQRGCTQNRPIFVLPKKVYICAVAHFRNPTRSYTHTIMSANTYYASSFPWCMPPRVRQRQFVWQAPNCERSTWQTRRRDDDVSHSNYAGIFRRPLRVYKTTSAFVCPLPVHALRHIHSERKRTSSIYNVDRKGGVKLTHTRVESLHVMMLNHSASAAWMRSSSGSASN